MKKADTLRTAKQHRSQPSNEGSRRVRASVAIISGEEDVAAGIRSLRRRCAFMRKAHDMAGTPPLRRDLAGFAGLARIIVAQQVSASAARAIWSRVETTVTPMSARTVLRLDDETLRGCGLSRPKVRTLRAIAEAVDGGLDLERCARLDENEVREQLTAISGVGPWTADIYQMFCLGRADMFAPGDLALQIATAMLMELDAKPNAGELAEIAERWSPWRGVAARLLWHYYAAEKSRPMP